MIRDLWLRIKRFILPYPLAFIGKYSMKLVLSTCKIKIQGLERFKGHAAQGRCILLIWHNRIALTCEFFKHFAPEISYAAFLSKSRDGEPIARIIQSYPNASSIRVAHDTRHTALHAVIARLKSTSELMIITPDGPRGPRYKVKEGVVLAAKAAAAQIIPYTWEANRYWEFKTWDGFRIPRPFTKITIALGEPVLLAAESSTAEASQQLEQAMLTLKKEVCPSD